MKNKLFQIPKPLQNPALRLFCFPFAGGAANTFLPWAGQFGNQVELVLVQPPGRGARLVETPHDNMTDLVNELMEHAHFITSTPYVFFGHSLGSRVAFELSYRLQTVGLPLPAYFIGSGSRAPHLEKDKAAIFDLPQDEFMQRLEELNGTPKEVLQNKELMALLQPLLRADFKIADTYQATKVSMQFPILVLNGAQDTEITPAQLQAWQELSSVSCRFVELPGDHFFLIEHELLVVQQVMQVLTQVLATPNPQPSFSFC